jgi:hypothetical protein
MDDNIQSLGAMRAEREQDNRLWSPIECLEEAIRDLKSGEMSCTGLVILFVDQGNEEKPVFTVNNYAANIRASSIITAFEAAKVRLLADMGYP